MTKSNDKDRWGDKLKAAERARENLYFAKLDEQLIEKIRAEQAEAQAKASSATAPSSDLGDCPRCGEPLRSGQWRDLEIEFCPGCGGLWLDQNDLLDLADRGDVDLQLKER